MESNLSSEDAKMFAPGQEFNVELMKQLMKHSCDTWESE